MFEEIARACAELAPGDMVRLLRAVARHAAGEDAVAAALRHGVSETFDALVAVADAEGAAFYVDRYLDGASPEEAAIPAGLAAVVARPAVAAWLGEAIGRLDLTAVTALWAARLAADEAFGDSLAAAAPAVLDAALQIALLDAGRTEARRLAGRLLRLHCARAAPDPVMVRTALGILLAQPPSDADVALADPQIVRAVEALAPTLSAALAERAVLPAMRAARRREDLHRAAWALLAANDAGGAP